MTVCGNSSDICSRLILVASGIGLALSEAGIRVGTAADSHIVLPPDNKDCQVSLRRDALSHWSMRVEGAQGAFVGDRFYTQGHDEIFLRHGDIIKVGNVQFQLSSPSVAAVYTSAPVVAVAAGPQVWQTSVHAGVWPEQIPTQEQIATESLRIVADPRRQRRKWRRVGGCAMAAVCCLVLSGLILSRQFAGLGHHSQPKVLSAAKSGETLSGGDLAGRWLAAAPVPLLHWDGLPQALNAKQDKMAQCFHAAHYAEAEQLYRDNIFPYLHKSLKATENLGRYNGLACRWLALLSKVPNDPAMAQQLRQELAAVELQISSYVSDVSHQERFRQLLHYVRTQLPK